jgi:hypothetical protein
VATEFSIEKDCLIQFFYQSGARSLASLALPPERRYRRYVNTLFFVSAEA